MPLSFHLYPFASSQVFMESNLSVHCDKLQKKRYLSSTYELGSDFPCSRLLQLLQLELILCDRKHTQNVPDEGFPEP